MMQEGQKAPFDVVDQRIIFYDLGDLESVDKARGALVAEVNWLDDNPGQARNPLSAYGQFKEISSGSGSDMAGEAVAKALRCLSNRVSRVERQLNATKSVAQVPLYGRSVVDALLECDVGLVTDEGTMREYDRIRDYLRMFRASAAHGAVGDERADD